MACQAMLLSGVVGKKSVLIQLHSDDYYFFNTVWLIGTRVQLFLKIDIYKKKMISVCVFPEGPVVQEEQMDCGATNPDPSATIAQVNNWCQADRTQ